MRLPMCGVLVLTHNFEISRPDETRLPVFVNCGLWFQRGQWQNCKSKQASGCGFREGSGKIVSQNKQRWWSFDSKPILVWLQLYFAATGNIIHFLILSKLKLGLELKQKFAPKPQIKNNSPNPENVKKQLLSRLWNLRGW